MLERYMFRASTLIALFAFSPALAGSKDLAMESVEATICRLIDTSARARGLPVAFLTRLVWQESSFRADAISPAGAQGIAQFMPRTADDRGLSDPFDPAGAIPKAAELLVDLRRRFGNLGLAAAAYNAGPTRLAAWIAGRGFLPPETRDYVLTVTRHPVEDWISDAATATTPEGQIGPAESCSQEIAAIRHLEPRHLAGSALLAPWGVQLVGSFSKAAALAAYVRAQSVYSAILGDSKPMILGGRVLGRGFAPYYRIRAPAQSRAAANALCAKILRAGGACAVLRS
jgi:hypothetical protein